MVGRNRLDGWKGTRLAAQSPSVASYGGQGMADSSRFSLDAVSDARGTGAHWADIGSDTLARLTLALGSCAVASGAALGS